MKAALSLTFVFCLVGTTLQVTAQERIDTTGPITRAVRREAVRLAGDLQSEPADSNWSRVRALAPGTEIVVTVRGSEPGKRCFVLADGSELTALNLTDPALDRATIRALLEMASKHSEYFASANPSQEFVNNDLRVARTGVFISGRKVADLEQVLDSIPTTKVVEITTRRRHGSGLGALGGAVGVSLLTWAVEHNASPSWGVYFTSLFGAPVAGGVAGYYGFGRTIEEVIYRAP